MIFPNSFSFSIHYQAIACASFASRFIYLFYLFMLCLMLHQYAIVERLNIYFEEDYQSFFYFGNCAISSC